MEASEELDDSPLYCEFGTVWADGEGVGIGVGAGVLVRLVVGVRLRQIGFRVCHCFRVGAGVKGELKDLTVGVGVSTN